MYNYINCQQRILSIKFSGICLYVHLRRIKKIGLKTKKYDNMNSGDTSWMLCSSALVMIMTPGLGFFYGGMVKRSNMLSTITYCFIIFAEITIIWYLIGFSLVFSPSNNGFIGDLEYAVLENVGSDPNPYYATTIPFGLFFFYQLKFAGITPALIIGAIVDRVKLLPLLVFVLFWIIFVYFPRPIKSIWIIWKRCLNVFAPKIVCQTGQM